MSQSGYSPATALRGPMLLVFFLSVALVGGPVFAWFSYVARFQAARCPSDTFMLHDHPSGLVIATVFFFFPALTILLFSVLYPVLIRDLDSREISECRSIRKVSGFVAAVSGLFMVYAAPAQLFGQFCLTPRGIYVQDGVFDHLRLRPWSEVGTVTNRCFNTKGWGATMRLRLRGGDTIVLGSKDSKEAWSEGLPKIVQALHGHDFQFDAVEVEPTCRAPGAALISTRP